jgi:tRNA dimethylallyltransferase
MIDKVLIISGPTGVGKTGFALDMAEKFNGELVSADSRQVYEGMDIVTGKDLPVNVKYQMSNIQWRDKFLKYYVIHGIKVWLYDIVSPIEEFNVSFWTECANLVISDIHSRNKLPIVVGGTGLYVRSLTEGLTDINIPQDSELRKELADKDSKYLFEYLKKIDPAVAKNMNDSDRQNPRRLIRKIEISGKEVIGGIKKYDYLQLGLTAPLEELDKRIIQRVKDRTMQGAKEEFDSIRNLYDQKLPSLSASGYRDWDKWEILEKQYSRRQLTWFKKYGNIHWFDVTTQGWNKTAENMIAEWYN